MFNKRDMHSMLCNTYVVDPVILVCHKSAIFVNAKKSLIKDKYVGYVYEECMYNVCVFMFIYTKKNVQLYTCTLFNKLNIQVSSVNANWASYCSYASYVCIYIHTHLHTYTYIHSNVHT